MEKKWAFRIRPRTEPDKIGIDLSLYKGKNTTIPYLNKEELLAFIEDLKIAYEESLLRYEVEELGSRYCIMSKFPNIEVVAEIFEEDMANKICDLLNESDRDAER